MEITPCGCKENPYLISDRLKSKQVKDDEGGQDDLIYEAS